MIVFLAGPTGSGKTDASWGLVSMGDMVFLDCDWFASRSPFSWKNSTDVESVYRALLSQIDFHYNEGRRRFVVTLTFEMAVLFPGNRHRFAAYNLPLHAFRLFCMPEVIKTRILARDRAQKNEELTNAISGLTEFDRLFPGDSIFSSIDASHVSSEAIADTILKRIGMESS